MAEQAQAFEVQRAALGETRVVAEAVPEPADGQALLQVDAFAFTANNVTYGVAGDAIGYWQFFPAAGAPDEGWGRIPVWGFGDVVRSRAEGVTEGQRYYGYFPMACHLLVQPERAGAHGFHDGSAHRAALPPVYNQYTLTSGDPAYLPEREGMQMLFRPLFLTSFFLDDWLQENDFFGADTVVLASASSKTAFGLAWLLHRGGRCRVVGLTSARNAGFCESLGCYHQVLTYDAVSSLPVAPTVLVDMAGSKTLREQLHHHYGDALRYSCSVGVTHWENADLAGDPDLPGPPPTLFFVPTQIEKRAAEWGPQELARRTAAAWDPFVAAADGWIDVKRGSGAEAVRQVYQDVLNNRARASDGFILSLGN